MKEGARVMSLTDGTSKMSKSDPVEGSRINLTDSPDVIAKKASTAVRSNQHPAEFVCGVTVPPFVV